MYHGMQRCRFCEHWQIESPYPVVKGCRLKRGCARTHANYTDCERFLSAGLLPESAVDVEVASG